MTASDAPSDKAEAGQPTSSDQPAGENLAEIQKRGCRKALFWGCFPVLLLLGSVYGVLHYQMISTREALAKQTESDLAALKARTHDVRALLEPERAGNAADFYLAAEWCLDARPGLENPPKAFEDHALIQFFQKARALQTWKDADSYLAGKHASVLPVPASLLGKLGTTAPRPSSRKPRPLTKAQKAELRRSMKLCQLIRDAARCTKADWRTEFDRGFVAPIPNLLHLRVLARLMRERARSSKNGEALSDGLATIAFGQNIAEAELLITAMIGVAIETDGYRLVEEMICHPQSKCDLERTLAVLDRVKRPSISHLLDCERAIAGAGLAPIAGRRLSSQPKTMQVDSFSGTGLGEKLRNNPVLMTREWAIYDDVMRRIVAATELPQPTRSQKLAAINAEIKESWSVLARMLVINLQGAEEHLVETELANRCLRVLIAAQLHRLETGAFPKTLATLAPRLGGAIPTDPHRGGALAFVSDGTWVGVGSTASKNPAWWTTVPGSVTFPKSLANAPAAPPGQGVKPPKKAKTGAGVR